MSRSARVRPSAARPSAARLAAVFALFALFAPASCGEDSVSGLVPDGVSTADDTAFDRSEVITFDAVGDGATQPDIAADTAACPGCDFAPCQVNSDCDSGFCLDGPTGLECAKTCSDTCPAGYGCRGIANPAGDPTYVCVYEHLTYCEPCRIDLECELGLGASTGARCVATPDGDGSFCATRCVTGSCPEGATCEQIPNAPAGVNGCFPIAGECTCNVRATNRQSSTDCYVSNDAGTCDGVRACGPGGLSACDAQIPTEELCNGLDDNCDGQVDEAFPDLGVACDGDDDDKCKDGVFVCSADGTSVVCNDGPESRVELCNGLDDDCDGVVDNGFEDKGKPCDGDDDDFCADGQWVCSADGLSLICNDGPESRVEICNYIDDNCDGQTDEGFEGLMTPCDGDDDDLCADGIWICSADGLGMVCTDGPDSRVEICNDLDDDCDGLTDEDFPLKGLPCDSPIDTDLCMDGVWVCGPDGGLICDDDDDVSKVETCSGVDDDCDGLTDLDDPDLVAPLNPNQNGACQGTVQQCTGVGGWVVDYAGVPGYGLPEVPNGQFIDDNCDGLDGDVNQAVFVSTSGTNNPNCSRAAPCATINHAIGQTSGSRRHVYIQAGTYNEIVNLDREVHLFGGFNAQWVRRPHTELGHRVVIRGAKHAGDAEYVTVRARNATATLSDLVLQATNPGATERKDGRGLSSYVVHGVSSNLTLARVEVLQGNAASGADGTPGTAAASLTAPAKATKGGDGIQDENLCDATSKGAGGAGRTNTECSTGTAGGKGGDGGTMDTTCVLGVCWLVGNCDATAGKAGAVGSGVTDHTGGTAGSGSQPCQTPGGGGPGKTKHGDGGPAGPRDGRLSGDYWIGGSGVTGGLGLDGSGGGGGGGAGGCDGPIILQNSSGAGGGGGGGGGCRAAAAGTGGQPGGSSVGVFLRGGSLTVTGGRFQLGNGGAGGKGGDGGQGQPGGLGGDGGQGAGTSKSGGAGGEGGHGGHSGGGGGGAGGSAYGVLSLEATVTVSPTTEFTSGSVGVGGSGGTAPSGAPSSAAGAKGEDGRVDDRRACTSPTSC